MTRKDAYQHIKIAVAKTGKMELHTIRLYVESGLSSAMFKQARQEGLAIFNRERGASHA